MNPTTATPHGSPEQPSPPKSGGDARRPSRTAAALSDVTNLLLLRPETPTPAKPKRSARWPHSAASASSSACSSSASATPAAPDLSSAADLEGACSAAKSPAVSTVYARRGNTEGRGRREAAATNKGKSKANKAKATTPTAAAGTASCPQLGKSTRDNSRKTSMAQDTLHISSSAPCHEAKKKRPSSSTPKLPEDFVKKQRAYFADVDAFELPEEEVSETDLD